MSTESRRIQMILDLVHRFPSASAAGFDASTGIEGLDDCAVIPLLGDVDLVIGSDFVRGEGFYLFQRGILSHEDIGYYLVAANASDLAAMGAAPLGIVVVLRYRPDMTDDDFKATMTGVARACAEFSLPLLGGDTGGYELSVLSAAAFGICPRGRALLRSGGAHGDRLYLSGSVGTAGAALAYFTRGRDEGVNLSPEIERALATAWRRIHPALPQGKLLVEQGLSKCAIDTSDGLKAAARQLAEASRLDAVLIQEKIPIAPPVDAVAGALHVDPLALAISDSVDFRLLFSASEDNAAKVQEEFQKRGWELFEVGYFANSKGLPAAYLQGNSGELSSLPGVEWSQANILSIDVLRSNSMGST